MNRPVNKEELEKLVDERIKKVVPVYLVKQGFSARKLTDTPNDDLQVVNRKYVNMYGTTANRPIASIATRGMFYFDTVIGRPVYFNPNSSVWTDGAGSVS